MPRHTEQRFLPYTSEQMFDLVSDIGRYAEFLPWVQAMRIKSNDGTTIVADMAVGFKMVRERFTSRVTLDRPNTLHVDYVAGPLKYLRNDWRFESVAGGCMVYFAVDFEFQSRIFERLAGLFFSDAFRRMVASFERRAAEIYGAPAATGISNSSAQRTA
ncbi:MAG: type II toxin-antitoxin system RatA family toxin [Janthinobacterium lividum]